MTKTEQKIITTAGRLFSRFGFTGVSMEDIAKKLKISKAALYHHFKSKEEIYLETLERSLGKLIKTIEQKIEKTKTKRERISKIIEAYLEFGIKEKNLIKSSLFEIPKSRFRSKKRIDRIREKINLIFRKYLGNTADGKHFVSLLLGAMDTIILETDFSKNKLNLREVISKILKIFFPVYS